MITDLLRLHASDKAILKIKQPIFREVNSIALYYIHDLCGIRLYYSGCGKREHLQVNVKHTEQLRSNEAVLKTIDIAMSTGRLRSSSVC